jgi:hypothetical protein
VIIFVMYCASKCRESYCTVLSNTCYKWGNLLDEFGKVMRQDRGRREGGSTALPYSSGLMDASDTATTKRRIT